MPRTDAASTVVLSFSSSSTRSGTTPPFGSCRRRRGDLTGDLAERVGDDDDGESCGEETETGATAR